MSIDWKAKLSSRKFWALLAGLLVSVLLIFGADTGTIEKVSGAITALGSVAVYILAEAHSDAAAVESEKTNAGD